MTTQVFRGRSAFEARRAAEAVLGQEAIVLTTRRVRRLGIAGIFGASDVEIAAARPAVPQPRRGGPFAADCYEVKPPGRAADADVKAHRVQLRNEIRTLKATLARPPAFSELAAEIAAMRAAEVTALLRAVGVEGAAASAILRGVRDAKGAEATVLERFRDAVADVSRVAPWPLATDQKCILALVGPSGVGKTTTAAKLAARAVADGRTIALIACDVFRVGAIDQLRHYASLLNSPFETAVDGPSLARAVAAAEADIVIVDTSGREPQPDGPESFLATPTRGRVRHVLLCVPASLRAGDAERAVRSFAASAPTAIAVTKIDETNAPSGLLHGSVAAKLPVSVFCFGQRVPEDIAPATAGALVDYLAPKRTRKPGGT